MNWNAVSFSSRHVLKSLTRTNANLVLTQLQQCAQSGVRSFRVNGIIRSIEFHTALSYPGSLLAEKSLFSTKEILLPTVSCLVTSDINICPPRHLETIREANTTAWPNGCSFSRMTTSPELIPMRIDRAGNFLAISFWISMRQDKRTVCLHRISNRLF